MPDTSDLSWDKVPLGPFDNRLWWLLIGLCLALLLTIQAIETAIEGAWPHQRRASRMVPGQRAVQMSWGFVALLVIPGALLLIGNVAVLIWRDPERPEQLVLGSVLTGIGWALFLDIQPQCAQAGQAVRQPRPDRSAGACRDPAHWRCPAADRLPRHPAGLGCGEGIHRKRPADVLPFID